MIGMGLHSGPAISGTIGSSERMEYTVIGDTVNMTSRIESSTKAFGADLLVSETVSQKVGEEFLFEEAGSAEVKGKSEPLKLFKVRGYRENGQWVEITTPFSDYEKGDADKVKVA
jgi:adenylate cyclase